jgi:amino acid transporter
MGITAVKIIIIIIIIIIILTTDIPTLYIFAQCIFHFNFGTYDVAYAQFRQDPLGSPEDGVPAAPKHEGARLIF